MSTETISYIIGIVGGSLSVLSFAPFLWKIFKQKNLNNVSLGTYVIYFLSCLLWIMWAMFSWLHYPNDIWKNVIVIVPNFICGIATIIIVILKMISLQINKNKLPK